MLQASKMAELEESLNIIFRLADQSDFKLIKIQALAFILNNKPALQGEVYYEHAQHNFTEMINESGFKKDGFIDGPALLDM